MSLLPLRHLCPVIQRTCWMQQCENIWCFRLLRSAKDYLLPWKWIIVFWVSSLQVLYTPPAPRKKRKSNPTNTPMAYGRGWNKVEEEDDSPTILEGARSFRTCRSKKAPPPSWQSSTKKIRTSVIFIYCHNLRLQEKSNHTATCTVWRVFLWSSTHGESS